MAATAALVVGVLGLPAQPALAKGGVPPANGILVGPNLVAGQGYTTPFDITGAIESLVPFGAALNSGGTVVVNGTTVIIPTNLVMTLPAAYKTVGQLMAESPAPGQSGLALKDPAPPIAAYEISISGNIVNGAYIAGLVSIAQQSLNTTNGFVQMIDYSTGEMCVGPTAPPPGGLVGAYACPKPLTRVRINDPSGRYGLADGPAKTSPDARFSVDTDNPTIHAASGYPMCVPRVAPPAVDPLCPMGNRRREISGAYATQFVMSASPLAPPAAFAGVGVLPPCSSTQAPSCNVRAMAPLVPGDYIAYSGVLAKDTAGNLYNAVYALEANVGIYTSGGSNGGVFYVYMDAPLITSGPVVCPGNAECQARLRTEMFITDPYLTPSMYAVDESPTGVRTSRPLPSVLINTAVMGRYVYHTEKDTRVFGTSGNGVTREIMTRLTPGTPGAVGSETVAGAPVFYGDAAPVNKKTDNDLVWGQYISPVGEYIFPEPNSPGAVLPPYNFGCLGYTVNGWAQGGALQVGKLAPYPVVNADGRTGSCNNY